MMDLFSDAMRRDPYPLYDQLRSRAPVFHDPLSGLWMVFDYDGVKRVLTDPEVFSSRYGPAWLIFTDPPRHTKMRALISQAFTPRSVAGLEPRIRELSRTLLDRTIDRGEMDLAADYSIPLPMLVIAAMLGIPLANQPRYQRWTDVILNMSHTIAEGPEAAGAMNDFMAVAGEMGAYLAELLAERRSAPKDDLLTRLAQVELEGDRLTQEEILGFFQLLLLAGSETTTNLIDNAVLCLLEHPDQFERLRQRIELLPSAIEEVLRYRSPLQWMYRLTTREVALAGHVIPAGRLVLAMIGSANRDSRQFPDAGRFEIARAPNAHLAFGHGLHFCLGAPLARLEARVALTDILQRLKGIQRAGDETWKPRKGLNVLGPTSLRVRFDPGERLA